MDSTIVAAVIGAVAVIAAAIIGALIALRKRGDPGQSVRSGGNAIVAGGHAQQHVHIGSKRSPEPPRLISVARDVQARTNECLIENERVLAPLLSNPVRRYAVGQQMATLFEEQRLRGAFGEWQSFLESAVQAETDDRISASIERLLSRVRQLHQSFYSYHQSLEEMGEPQTKKHFVELVLGKRGSDPRWYEVPDEEVVIIARNYLDFLRECVEDVGRASGELQALTS